MSGIGALILIAAVMSPEQKEEEYALKLTDL